MADEARHSSFALRSRSLGSRFRRAGRRSGLRALRFPTVAAEVAVTLWLGGRIEGGGGRAGPRLQSCQARHFDAAVEAKLASLMASGAHERGAVRQMLVPVFAYADIKDFSAPPRPRNERGE